MLAIHTPMDEQTEPSASTIPVDGIRFVDRLKPMASVRVQLLLAAAMWLVAAGILGVRGAMWVGESSSAGWFFLLAIAVGILKSQLLMERVAHNAVARILERGCTRCAGGFFSLKSWALILLMVAGGHALRLTEIPRPALGVLYVAVATALLIGDRIYWREAIKAG